MATNDGAPHLTVLEPNDVVVYDRGYFSYVLLHQHVHAGIHPIFRLHHSGFKEIREFIAGSDTDTTVTLYPATRTQRDIRTAAPQSDIIPLRLRLIKYEMACTWFCLGTTLVDPQPHYSLQDFMDVYHCSLGVEELYKISTRLFMIEDFHAKTKRGVKQELFAHFVLITMNRLCGSGQPRPQSRERLLEAQSSRLIHPRSRHRGPADTPEQLQTLSPRVCPKPGRPVLSP